MGFSQENINIVGRIYPGNADKVDIKNTFLTSLHGGKLSLIHICIPVPATHIPTINISNIQYTIPAIKGFGIDVYKRQGWDKLHRTGKK